MNPNGNNGFCVSLPQCNKLMKIIHTKQLTASQKEFFKKSLCKQGLQSGFYICCSDDVDFGSVKTHFEHNIVWSALPKTQILEELTSYGSGFHVSDMHKKHGNYETGIVWGVTVNNRSGNFKENYDKIMKLRK